MKCLITDSQEIDSLKIEERPAPGTPGACEVLVEVKAVSLNYRDILAASGQYGAKPALPFIVGSDMAGKVLEVGKEVSDLKPGDRVLNAPFKFWPAGKLKSSWAKTFIGANGVDGVLCQQVLYPASSLVKVPEHLSYVEASTLPIAGLTAWSAVVTHGHTRPGDWILLQGTGGVSIFAAQIAEKLGARTIMTTSNAEKSRLVKEKFGVHATLDYRDAGWAEKVRALAEGQGVHLVVEVAGDSLAESIRSCRSYGRVALIGILGGAESNVNVVDIFRRQITVRGIYMESAQELQDLARAMEAWGLKPCVDKVFSFEESKDAYKYVKAQKHIGKVVVSLGE